MVLLPMEKLPSLESQFPAISLHVILSQEKAVGKRFAAD